MFTASKRILGFIGFAGSVLASVNAPEYLQGRDESRPIQVCLSPFSYDGGCHPALSWAGSFASDEAAPAPGESGAHDSTQRGGDEDWIPEETSSPAPSEVREAAQGCEKSHPAVRKAHRLEMLRTRSALTVAALARRLNCDPAVLARLNGVPPTGRFEAQRDVLVYDGALQSYSVRKGDSLWDVHRRFGLHTACILFLNRMADTRLWPGQTLLIPAGPISEASEKAIRALPWIRRLLTPKNYVLRPVPGRITSPFGWRHHPVLKRRGFHTGIDVSAPRGTPIRSIASGLVRRARNAGPLGLCVVVAHEDGLHKSYYGHCAKLLVAEGDAVTEGQVIALVGRTGRATGPHVHFGLKRGQHFVNPTRNLDLRTAGPAPDRLASR